jgi:tRNA A-37 threonylcarbamoyl transferase component Bud32
MTDPSAPVLEVLRDRAASLFGDARAQLEPTAIFDRPYSTVIRLRIMTPETAPFYAFTKIYKVRPSTAYEVAKAPADVVRDEFAATSRLHAVLAGRPGLRSPRPIVALPEHGAIVTQEVEGVPLDTVLRHPPRRRDAADMLVAVATRIGAWVRTYQGLSAPAAVWSAADARAYLNDRLRYICPRVLNAEARRDALYLFDRLAARIVPGSEPLVPIHADLCPANILVAADGGIAVLDFATTQMGTRYHDIAHLYLHLDLARRRRWRRAATRPIEDALIAGFDRPAAVHEPMFRLMLLQHAVCHVTQIVDEGGRVRRLTIPALARWRWRTCFAMPELADPAEPVTLQAV